VKRLHVHVAVHDLQQSIRFYSALFGAEPAVKKEDYARLDYYDVWLPELAPSQKVVSWALAQPLTGKRWAKFERDYRREMYKPEAARLITLYRQKRAESAPPPTRAMGLLATIGAVAADLPARITDTLDFTGGCAAALPKVVASPRSVDWRSLPWLVQQIGADALPVTSAANLLVGVIIGFLGVSQLGRFGAVVYVPELVVVAHFRELGDVLVVARLDLHRLSRPCHRSRRATSINGPLAPAVPYSPSYLVSLCSVCALQRGQNLRYATRSGCLRLFLVVL